MFTCQYLVAMAILCCHGNTMLTWQWHVDLAIPCCHGNIMLSWHVLMAIPGLEAQLQSWFYPKYLGIVSVIIVAWEATVWTRNSRSNSCGSSSSGSGAVAMHHRGSSCTQTNHHTFLLSCCHNIIHYLTVEPFSCNTWEGKYRPFNARGWYSSLWPKTIIFEKSVSRLPGNTDRPVERHMEESLEDDPLLAYKKIFMTRGQFFVTKGHNF